VARKKPELKKDQERECPRSPYVGVYETICRAYEENNRNPLTMRQLRRTLQSEPGLLFWVGTVDDVLRVFQDWHLVYTLKRKQEELVVPIYR